MLVSLAFGIKTFLPLLMLVNGTFAEPFPVVAAETPEENLEIRSLYQTSIDQLPLPADYCVAAEKLLDIAILMDTSLTTNVGGFQDDFYNTVDFALYLTRAFELGPSKTRVSLLRFINHIQMISNFTAGTSHLDVQRTLLSQAPQVSGITFNTAEALAFAASQIFTAWNGVTNPAAKKVLILITFTQISSNFLFQAAKDKIQTAGIDVFVVAVGEALYSQDLLKSLTLRQFSDYVAFQTSTEMAGNDALNTALIDAYGGCDQCIPNPCVHGTCTIPTQFECKCDVGYKGVICNDIDYCVPNNPCHSQTCTNPIDRIIICTCTAIGRYGEYCQFVDHCVAVPGICRNGGTCQTNRTIQVTKCLCAMGYYGDTCINADNCVIANPCQHRGACSHDRDTHLTSCQCIFPYTGATCADCLCQNGGKCTLAIASGSCNCPLNCNGNVCETCIPYCNANPTVCQNGGSCNSTGITYQCLCADNCSGRNCETCSAGTCDMPNTPCPAGKICKEVHVGDFVCTCPQGCSGVNCEQCSYCDKNPMTCFNGGTCIDQPMGKFLCQCPQNCGGAQCDVCMDPCAGYCQNNGTCILAANQTISCSCMSMCYGAQCESCYQAFCPSNPTVCQNGGTCVDKPRGEYSCMCPPNYSGQVCESYVYCESNPATCHNAGTCINNSGNFSCQCRDNCHGERCEVCLLPCDINPALCLNEGICENVPMSQTHPDGEFMCSCKHGCTGKRCEVCPNKCNGNNPCQNGATCIGSATDIYCNCTVLCYGDMCQFCLDLCVIDPARCIGGTCRDLGGGEYLCVCSDHCNGPRCETCQHCGPGLCLHGGTCVNNTNGFGYVCECTESCTGENCETCNNFNCFDNPGMCQNGGSCVNSVCQCTPLCSGEACEVCTEFCTMYPSTCQHGGTCQSTPGGGHLCHCVFGCYGNNCEDCPCLGFACLNGGTCLGVQGAPPSCQCPLYYTGQNCEVEVNDDSSDPCDPNPCLNGCSCVESCQHSGGYICKGSFGYIGKNCEIEPPTLDCRPNSIEIRVPEDFARSKSRSGNGEMQVYVGGVDSVGRSSMCSTSEPINGQYVITLFSPFSSCGNMKRRQIGLDETITSDIWVNLFPNGLNGFAVDMPVPIATFECIYNGDYTLITSLRPVLTEFPTISEEVRFTPQVSLCKTSSCPSACPAGLSIVREAVYTVGQTVYVTLTTQPVGNLQVQSIMHSTLSRLVLSCGETPFFPGVELVSNGCTAPNQDVTNLDFVLSQSGMGHVICLSFRAARLVSCKSQFFIHADVKICQTKDKEPCPASANVQRCINPISRKRRARSIRSSEQPIVIGPFYVFEKGGGIPSLNYTEDIDIEFGVGDKKETQPEKDMMSLPPAWKYIIVALFIFVIITALVCAFFILRRASVANSYRFS